MTTDEYWAGVDIRAKVRELELQLAASEADRLRLRDAMVRAERKLSAYVGVCKGDKELTEAVLPMCQEALSTPPGDLLALREFFEQTRERCAKECDKLQGVRITGGTAGNYWKREAIPIDCSKSIRAIKFPECLK